MTTTQWLAIWAIASVVSAPFIGEWIAKNRRTNKEFRELHSKALTDIRINRLQLLEAERQDLADQESRELNQDSYPHPKDAA